MEPVNLLLFAGAVAFLGGGTWLALKHHAQSTLNAHVILDNPAALLGGEVTLGVHVRPRQAVSLDRIVARTRCLRRSVEGSGRDSYEDGTWWLNLFFDNRRNDSTWVERDEVARSEIQISGPLDLRAGQSQSFEAKVPVADGLPTDTSGPLTISWVLEVEFEIPNSPDVTVRRPLKVQRRY